MKSPTHSCQFEKNDRIVIHEIYLYADNTLNGYFFSVLVYYRLLDVLAGRKDPRGLIGTLLLDGCPPPDNFKCMVGYVVQVNICFLLHTSYV